MSTDNPKLPPQPDKPRAEIDQLAKEVVAGTIFGTWNISPADFNELYPVIFLPIAANVAIPENAGAAYEYMDKSFNKTIRGYPVFTTVRWLSHQDSQNLGEILMRMEFPS